MSKIDDATVMRLWRESGLPEYFLGNGGTNAKLVAFAHAVANQSGLRAALEPFAKEAERYRNYPDDYPVAGTQIGVCVGDLRAAAAQLSA